MFRVKNIRGSTVTKNSNLSPVPTQLINNNTNTNTNINSKVDNKFQIGKSIINKGIIKKNQANTNANANANAKVEINIKKNGINTDMNSNQNKLIRRVIDIKTKTNFNKSRNTVRPIRKLVPQCKHPSLTNNNNNNSKHIEPTRTLDNTSKNIGIKLLQTNCPESIPGSQSIKKKNQELQKVSEDHPQHDNKQISQRQIGIAVGKPVQVYTGQRLVIGQVGYGRQLEQSIQRQKQKQKQREKEKEKQMQKQKQREQLIAIRKKQQQQQLKRQEQAQKQIQKILARRKQRQLQREQSMKKQKEYETKLQQLKYHNNNNQNASEGLAGLMYTNDPLAHFQFNDLVMDLQIEKILRTSFSYFPSGDMIQLQKKELERINQSYKMIKNDQSNNRLSEGLKNFRIQLFNRIGQLIVHDQNQGFHSTNFKIMQTNPHLNTNKINNQVQLLRGIPKTKISQILKPTIAKKKEQCAICLEQIEIGGQCNILACLHVFHVQCSCNWVEIHANCPACRKNLKFG